EPTSALTEREVDTLFDLLRRLAQQGVGILYISHKLDEIFRLSDRITVLRDGQYIGTVETAKTSTDEIIRMMVGRELGSMYPEKGSQLGKPLLEVRDLRLPGSNARNSFTLRAGEIVGMAGLIGAGRTEIARAIFGVDPISSGQIIFDGQPVKIQSPSDAIRLRMGYLPEDRKAAGLFLDMSVKWNIDSVNRPAVTRYGFVNPPSEASMAREYIDRLAIVTPSIEQEVRRLSGGNQQKVLVAKWLAIRPRVFIVDEPTRGVDVGAKSEIHHLLRELADEGVAVLMISSELPEILGLSDRILVMHEGAIVADLDGSAATEETIMQYASGQVALAQ